MASDYVDCGGAAYEQLGYEFGGGIWHDARVGKQLGRSRHDYCRIDYI